jgi:hypothetical protein
MNTSKIARPTLFSRTRQKNQIYRFQNKRPVRDQSPKHPLLGALPILAVASIAVLALGGCNSVPTSGDHPDFSKAIENSDKLIVPGERIGPIRIGMRQNEVLRLLGRPEKVRKHLPGAIGGPDPGYDYRYDNQQFHVGFPSGPSPTVNEIVIWDTQFATEEGVRIGDSENDLLRKRGPPATMFGKYREYAYGYKRLTAQVGPDGRVGNISVWISGSSASGSPGLYLRKWNDGHDDIDGDMGYRLHLEGPRCIGHTGDWSAKHMIVSGSFPPGIDWSPGSDISGIPTERGTWPVTVRLYDIEYGGTAFPQAAFEQQLLFHIKGSLRVHE